MASGSNVKLPQLEASSGDRSTGERFQARNRTQLNKKEIQKLPPHQRSRYLAYESPAKEVAESMSAARKRLKELKKQMKKETKPPALETITEQDKHVKLIGQLKAAEARNRIRLMRLRYEHNRASEVNHLISCQPTALKAVRLQSLVPPETDPIKIRDLLGKGERYRVNALLEDEVGLETARIIS
ncbi:protein LKAAEAR1 [Nematostella vectensis]|uniref:protein LKAAEAR1 n=1 Tax=Nematostella vectensis TaxID=45351 RepID=UPI002076E996|nr:protein LKAAEAR1 [Nematostella vectensis]